MAEVTLYVRAHMEGEFKIPRIEWATLRQAMEKQMHLIQNRAAENARTNLRRDRASTGRLARAVENPKNVKMITRGAKPVGFAVGIISFLDSDASKVKYYWRAIEEGSSRMVGRTMGGPRGLGTWGGGVPIPGQGGQTRYPPPVMASPPYALHARGKFLPLGWYNAAGVTTGDVGVRKFVIHNGIEPHRYYERSWEETNSPAAMRDAFRNWARVNGLPLSI
jgi:hypothetical protein